MFDKKEMMRDTVRIMTNSLISQLERASLEDLVCGHIRETAPEAYVCLFCGKRFEEGVVYPFGTTLFTASGAVRRHVAEVHGDPFDALLRLGKEHTGISELQEAVLRHTHAGAGDRETAALLGGKSPSTVRNHRFQLRKRRREAKLFLAIMELLDRKEANQGYLTFNAALPVADDRVKVTDEEARKILKKHFISEDPLVLASFPKKQKAKLVVLNRMVELFVRGRRYSEREVNELLAGAFDDYVTIRRYLIDYGFLDRKADGSSYWRTNPPRLPEAGSAENP